MCDLLEELGGTMRGSKRERVVVSRGFDIGSKSVFLTIIVQIEKRCRRPSSLRMPVEHLWVRDVLRIWKLVCK